MCLTTNPFKSYRNESTPLIPIAGFQHHHQSIEVDQVRLEVAGHLTAGLRISTSWRLEIDDSNMHPHIHIDIQ